MAGLSKVRAYVHAAVPPYQQVGGPLLLTAQERTTALSDLARGRIAVALDGFNPNWAAPGMVWGIESDLGEPYWAGFVEEPDWVRGASEVGMALVGPMTALLEREAAFCQAGSLPLGEAVRDAILTMNDWFGAGIEPGVIEAGPRIELPPSAETATQFIRNAAQLAGLDFLERVVRTEAGLEFMVDFATFGTERSTTVGASDVVAGVFRPRRPTERVTSYGAATTFGERQATAVSAQQTAGLGEQRVRTVPAEHAETIRGRAIGPGATKQRVLISERISERTEEMAMSAFLLDLKASQPLALTVETTKEPLQALRVGDIFRVRVADWAGGLGIDERVLIREIRPHEETGEKDIAGWVV